MPRTAALALLWTILTFDRISIKSTDVPARFQRKIQDVDEEGYKYIIVPGTGTYSTPTLRPSYFVSFKPTGDVDPWHNLENAFESIERALRTYSRSTERYENE